MIKKFSLIAVIVILLALQNNVKSQNVGISETNITPDGSAMLEVSSEDKGILIPRLTTTQRDAISSAAQSLLIYNTTTKCFEFWESGNWHELGCATIAWSCGDEVSDVEDNTYSTVQIGTQCWFAENLITTTYRGGASIGTDFSGTTGAYDCSGDVGFCTNYGPKYNWYATQGTGDNSICPEGWSVPTNDQWTTMENYLIANGYNYDGTTTGNKIAKALAIDQTPEAWDSGNYNWRIDAGTGVPGNTDYPTYRNKSGFSALAGGYCTNSLFYTGKQHYADFWTSSVDGSGDAYYKEIWWREIDLKTITTANKNTGFSVRCIKD